MKEDIRVSVLRDEIRELKQKNIEHRKIIKEFLNVLNFDGKNYSIKENIEKLVWKANLTTGNKEAKEPENITVIRRGNLPLSDTEDLFRELYGYRFSHLSDPDLNLKIHRYRTRPVKGNFIKIYSDRKVKFATIQKSVYEASYYSDGHMTIRERLYVRETKKKVSLSDCQYMLNETDVIFVKGGKR